MAVLSYFIIVGNGPGPRWSHHTFVLLPTASLHGSYTVLSRCCQRSRSTAVPSTHCLPPRASLHCSSSVTHYVVNGCGPPGGPTYTFSWLPTVSLHDRFVARMQFCQRSQFTAAPLRTFSLLTLLPTVVVHGGPIIRFCCCCQRPRSTATPLYDHDVVNGRGPRRCHHTFLLRSTVSLHGCSVIRLQYCQRLRSTVVLS